MEKIIKWIVSKVPFNQEMDQSGPARKDGRRKVIGTFVLGAYKGVGNKTLSMDDNGRRSFYG